MQLLTNNEAESLGLARALGRMLQKGDCLCLKGDLGAGKSVLARGIIRSFLENEEEEVPSPTFTLVQTYESPEKPVIWHFDLYRLSSGEEALELGLEEALAEGISIIEWPERLDFTPSGLVITIESLKAEQRRISLEGWEARLAAVFGDRAALRTGFLQAQALEQAEIEGLPSDASFRRYFRVKSPAFMLMDAPPLQEDIRPFVKIAGYLQEMGLRAPKVIAQDAKAGLALLEDFGDDTFTRLLAKGYSENRLYELAVDTLIKLHQAEKARFYPLSPYDDNRFLVEAMLLPQWYAPAVLGKALSPNVVEEYQDLWPDLLDLAGKVPLSLVLRDYHVDNLMVLQDGSCGLLDFQDALIGPASYDLASLLEDARRDIPADLIKAMKDRYLAAFPNLNSEDWELSLKIMAAQRHCKVIGIFTRLWVRDNKPVYLQHIPRLWWLLEENCRNQALAGLKDWLDKYIPPEKRIIPHGN